MNMKIITLNTWGGRAGRDNLLSFFEKYREDTDVFCLQEIWAAPYEPLEGLATGGLSIDHTNIMTRGMQEISTLLSDYTVFFHPHHLENYGLMMLVKNTWNVTASGDVFVYKHRGYIPEGDVGNHARNVQFVTLETEKGPLSILNFHGLWNGKGKTDSDDRITQSKNILAFIQTLKGKLVLCGDFNLLPDTESIRLFELAGLRNLIKEYQITSTRTSYYTKPEKYADYIFVTANIPVRSFMVLPEEVSDHAALQLVVDSPFTPRGSPQNH